MNGTLRTLVALVVIAPMATGCATRGALRRAIDEERVARVSADSSLMRETASLRADLGAVQTDVGTIRTDVTTLKSDVQALRSELTAFKADFDAKITAVEEGIQFMMPVNFAFDDAAVRPQDTEALDRFAKIASKYYPTAKITIEGFADPAGSATYNRMLSTRRAENVRDHLAKSGLNSALLHPIGYGETRQVVPGAQRDDAGAEMNRRVVFVIETKDASAIIATQDGVR
jgi:peptidoglycan-associated lipoprotein